MRIAGHCGYTSCCSPAWHNSDETDPCSTTSNTEAIRRELRKSIMVKIRYQKWNKKETSETWQRLLTSTMLCDACWIVKLCFSSQPFASQHTTATDAVYLHCIWHLWSARWWTVGSSYRCCSVYLTQCGFGCGSTKRTARFELISVPAVHQILFYTRFFHGDKPPLFIITDVDTSQQWPACGLPDCEDNGNHCSMPHFRYSRSILVPCCSYLFYFRWLHLHVFGGSEL